MLLSIEAQLCTHRECKTFRTMSHRLTHTLRIATDEGPNVLHSLRVHSCASMLNNICSESDASLRDLTPQVYRPQALHIRVSESISYNLEISLGTRLHLI